MSTIQINSYDFKYDPKNLDVIKLDIFHGAFDMNALIILIAIALLGAAIYVIAPYIQGYLMVSSEDRKRNGNKLKIKELILMKEIQNELEKEIEESMLNEGLRTSTV